MRFTILPLISPLVISAVFLTNCASPEPQTAKTNGPPISTSVIAAGHPLAKYLELVGFRISEKGAGKLQIKFAIVNHSEADIGDLSLKVRLTTTAAKKEDPPLTEFDVKIPALGPQEMKDITATATTKLRVYELPDWQFIRADVEITSPTQ